MKVTWFCLEPDCDAAGETDAAAARHTKATLHSTTTELASWTLRNESARETYLREGQSRERHDRERKRP